MTLALAAAWQPRGELARFQRLLPELGQVYDELVISLPPQPDPVLVEALRASNPRLTVAITNDWSWGRYTALQMALETHCNHIHYADFDRLLRWVETRPEEWQRTVSAIQEADCLLVGRTPAAYATHPQALVQTEAISNRVISHLLGRPVDVSAGSKGFSRAAAAYVIANTLPGHALGTDGEWPVLLQRAGFRVDYISVDGLDWESADRFQEQAANPYSQRQAAGAYDADPQNWQHRIAVAMEIVHCGLVASVRDLFGH